MTRYCKFCGEFLGEFSGEELPDDETSARVIDHFARLHSDVFLEVVEMVNPDTVLLARLSLMSEIDRRQN